MFEIALIGLGETPEELLHLFDNCNESPQIICSGLRADHFCIPHRTSDLLLHTPINLVNIQRSNTWELFDRQILLSYRKIVGSDELFRIYQESLNQYLNTNLGSWLKTHQLREDISLGIVKQISESLNPMSQAADTFEKERIGISVKDQLYRLPQQIILALSLYHGIKIGHIIDQLNELKRMRAVCDNTVSFLRELIHQVLQWRIQTQMHYKSSHEWLYQPNTHVPSSEIQPYRLNSNEQQQLKQMYSTVWSLYQSAKQWSEQEGNPLFLKSTTINRNELFGQVLVHARFNEMDEAIRCYRTRYCLDPHDIEGLDFEVHAQNQRYILTMGKMNQWKIWNQSLVRNWAVNCIRADLSLEVLEICRDLLVVPEEKTTFLAELEAYGKTNLSNIIDRSQLREAWLIKCQQEMEAYHFEWNKRIQQWKDEKKQQNKYADESVVEWYRGEQSRGAFAAECSIRRCQLFVLLRPAFERVRNQRMDLLKKAERELVMKHRELKVYQSIYQSLDGMNVRVAFRQILMFYQKNKEEDVQKFLSDVLTTLHRIPDRCGETTLWKEEKKRWKTILEKLVEDRAPKGNEPTFNSPLIGGCKPLKNRVAAQLLNENGKFKDNKISSGQRNVIPIKLQSDNLPTIYAKAWPEMPGMSHGTYHSELVCLKCVDGSTIPVLCSEAIHGPTLQEVFEKEPERLNKLDHQHYTELLF
ncbi:hypothetical protein RFI_17107, partial [Reticulomyxa filosa]